MRKQCEMLGLGHKLKLFDNGQEVVDYFVSATSKSVSSLNTSPPDCQVALLMLEINIPKMNGNEAME